MGLSKSREVITVAEQRLPFAGGSEERGVMANNQIPAADLARLPADPGSADEVQPSTVGAAHRASTREPASQQQMAYGDPLKDEIAAVAYRRWRERGSPIGSPEADWQAAEQELRAKP